MKSTDLTIRVYCGTYRKYNGGSIFGEWFDIDANTDMSELFDQFKELHKDEENPEFMFQDYEVPAILNGMVSECHISENLPAAISALINASYDLEVYEAYADCFGVEGEDIEQLISDAEEAYSGEYDSDEDFAQQMAEDCGLIDPKAGWPNNCIDWEQAALELMYDYAAEGGHYFRNV